jgi:hypothetical protein
LVQLREGDLVEILQDCARDGLVASHWRWGFQVDLSEWVWTDDGPIAFDAPSAALPNLVSVGGGRCVADDEWIGFEEIVTMFGEISGAYDPDEHEDAPEGADTADGTLFGKLPWLLEYLDENPWLTSNVVDEGKTAPPAFDPLLASGADVDSIYEILAAKRAEWAVEHAPARVDFSVDLLGGIWTEAHVGVIYDAFRGHAHRGEAEALCERYHLQRSFRCSVRSVPEEISHLLCSSWCSKRHVFFDKYRAEGDAVDYSDRALEAWVEDPAVTRLFLDAVGLVRERILKIRSIRPKTVV